MEEAIIGKRGPNKMKPKNIAHLSTPCPAEVHQTNKKRKPAPKQGLFQSIIYGICNYETPNCNCLQGSSVIQFPCEIN